MPGARASARPLLLLLLGRPAHAAVIQRITGANQSELSHLSSAGGAHVYIFGSDIGSAFAPPLVYVGAQAQAECQVQPFTSNRNRLHCIVHADGLPPPDPIYDAAGRFVEHPLRVYKGTRLAQCWHTGGLNHGCFLRCAPPLPRPRVPRPRPLAPSPRAERHSARPQV
jgi:hypothetical protein